MRRLLLILLLALMTHGCGSVFIEYPPPPPDFDTCYEFSDTMTSSTEHTPVAVPFWGGRTTTLWTRLPENWFLFKGSIHLTGLSWEGADWVDEMRLYVEYLLVAKWDGSAWEVFSRQDLRPSLTVVRRDGDLWLKFEARAESKGIKPAGKQQLRAVVTVQLCGEGAEYVSPFGQPFEAG